VETHDQAVLALKANNKHIKGQQIKVHISQQKENHDSDASKTVFVTNLPFTATENKLRAMFEPQVKSVRLPRDQESWKLKGYAYVEFESADELPRALALNKQQMEGRVLSVERARTED